MRDLPSYFSASYAQARAQFRTQAAQFGWQCESHPFAETGPDGEELALDVAIWPADSDEVADRPTIIVSSGLHGVEGFLGSAVQCALLDQGAEKAFPARLVLLHALNPFGFAHIRRFDAQNIDPNRNFLLPGEDFAGSPPLYATLDRLLNPRHPPQHWDFFLPRAVGFIVRYGMPALKQAIAGGQYDFPQGLFFGGHAPCATQQILSQHLPRWIAGSQQVIHFDIHTGLGRRGDVKLLLDYSPTAEQRQKLDHWFGPDAYETNHSTGTAYESRGSLGQWCRAQNFATDYLYLCAEFGTYPPLAVLAGLRKENQAHHWGDRSSDIYRAAKACLKEQFCPAANQWRTKVMQESLKLVCTTARYVAAR